MMRKEMGFTRTDRITVYIYSEPAVAEMVKRRYNELKNKKDLTVGEQNELKHLKSWA